jgi:hypothetical protein
VINLSELALREAKAKVEMEAVQAYAVAARARYEAARDEVQAALDSDAGRGVRAFGSMLPDGRPVVRVALSDPDPAPVVTDPAAFLDWVRDTYPTEHRVREVREANAAWQAVLFKAMKKLGKPVDPMTGQMVPGVEIPTERKRGHRLTFENDGHALITAALREGIVTPDVLPDLLTPEDDAA